MKPLFSLLLLGCWAASLAHAETVLLENWLFGDAAGTNLADATNSAGAADFGGHAAQANTNGSGQLVITQGADASANLFREAFLTNPDQNTGRFELKFAFAEVILETGDDTGANVGFGIRDDAGTSLFTVRIQRQSGTLRLQHRLGEINTTLVDFAVTRLSDLTVRVIADMDTDTFDVYWQLGDEPERRAMGIPMEATGRDFDSVRLQANTNTLDWGATDQVLVEYLSVSTAEAPTDTTTYLEHWPFNDPAGTELPDLENVAGTATVDSGKAQATTDGLGNLSFRQGLDTADNVFRNAPLSVRNRRTGIFEMWWRYATAAVAEGDETGANVGFGMRDEVANTDLFLVRLQKLNGGLRLQTRIGGTNGNLEIFGGTELADLRVHVVANLDTDTFDVSWQLGTNAEQSMTNIAFSAPDLDFDIVRIVANTNTNDWGPGDHVEVDYLRIAGPEAVLVELPLAIAPGDNPDQFKLLWPVSTPAEAVLVGSPDLLNAWTPVDGSPVVNGDFYELSVPAPTGPMVYRLSFP